MFGGWRERFNCTTQTSTSQRWYILWRRGRCMGFIKSTKINRKIILSGYSEPEAEWMRFRVSDWKIWFVASGNALRILPSSRNMPHYFHQCWTHVSFTFKSTILIYANSKGVCVMLCCVLGVGALITCRFALVILLWPTLRSCQQTRLIWTLSESTIRVKLLMYRPWHRPPWGESYRQS